MPVFCHDELICKMVARSNDLDLSVLVKAAQDAMTMLATEEKLRKAVVLAVSEEGVREGESEQVLLCQHACIAFGTWLQPPWPICRPYQRL